MDGMQTITLSLPFFKFNFKNLHKKKFRKQWNRIDKINHAISESDVLLQFI